MRKSLDTCLFTAGILFELLLLREYQNQEPSVSGLLLITNLLGDKMAIIYNEIDKRRIHMTLSTKLLNAETRGESKLYTSIGKGTGEVIYFD